MGSLGQDRAENGNAKPDYFAGCTGSRAYTWAKSYVYAGSRLLSAYTANGTGGETLEFHHPDRLGTRMVTNPSADTLYLQSTLPFGTSFAGETTGSSNRLFTSYDRSPSTGLDYAVNRTYSPGQGRFTQVDPIGMGSVSVGNPQSNNLFAYVQDKPTDLVDPNGLCPPGEIPSFEVTCVRVEGGEWECESREACRSANSRAGNSRGGGGGISVDRRRGGPIGPGTKRPESSPEKPRTRVERTEPNYPLSEVPRVENPAACAVAAVYFVAWRLCNELGGGLRFCQPLLEQALIFLEICVGGDPPDPPLPVNPITSSSSRWYRVGA